jgi:LmbE family N-acetylglucosaminyl deacetylase
MICAGRLHEQWRVLPIGSLDEVIGTAACLVLAPHPDDESLGCGGLIAACCANGRPPLVAILTDGSLSHPVSRQFPPSRLTAVREAEAAQAVGILGLPAGRLVFLREPDGKAPRTGPVFDSVVRRLADHVRASDCSAILTPWRHDPHPDHQAAALIGGEIARITEIRLLEYPVWGWTLPAEAAVEDTMVRGWRLEVAAYLPAKRRAIAAHASQYGRLITDDPAGFELPETLLNACQTCCETFLLP